MTNENVLQTIQKFLQDVLAPDVRELKARITSLENIVDVRFKAIDQTLSSLGRELNARFDAVDTRLKTNDAIAALTERVAMLEAKQR